MRGVSRRGDANACGDLRGSAGGFSGGDGAGDGGGEGKGKLMAKLSRPVFVLLVAVVAIAILLLALWAVLRFNGASIDIEIIPAQR